MNHILLFLFILSMFYILYIVGIFLLPIEIETFLTKKRKKKIFVSILLIIIFSISYLPHSFSSYNEEDITQISIRDGETGLSIEITNSREIESIISNLNEIVIKKSGNALFYLGYGYNVGLYSNDGNLKRKVIINASNRIRYKEFFYDVIVGEIDNDYIMGLFKRTYPSEYLDSTQK